MSRWTVPGLLVVAYVLLPLMAANTDKEKAGRVSVVITQADEDAIKKLLEEFRLHTVKVSLRSDLTPYLDCAAHRELLKQGWKVVPYLIDQAARQQSVEATLGAALIKDPSVTSPEQVAAWNQARRAKIAGDTLPPFVLATVLRELPAAKEEPSIGKPERIDTKFVGIRHSDSYVWATWWAANQGRFTFQTTKPLVLPPTEDGVVYQPHITTTARGGLLDIHAVDATHRDIIERAAAELGLEVFIGEHELMKILTSVRMKGVNFEEFVYMLGRQASVAGYPVQQTRTGWRVGGEQPAKPRANLNGWGILMERTVFRVGDAITVTVITRAPQALVDPGDPVFNSYGSFRVTTNDGRVVEDYRPLSQGAPRRPPEQRPDAFPIRVMLDSFCTLPAGEYNVSFRYLDHETPTVAIEIYGKRR